MAIGPTTAQAMAMLVQADPSVPAEERAGWLALLGLGPRPVAAADAAALVRVVGLAGACLTPAEAAARLGVSEPTLYRWQREGRMALRRTKIGRRRVGFLAEDVERMQREVRNG